MKDYMDKIIINSLDKKNKGTKELGNVIIETVNNLDTKSKETNKKQAYKIYYKAAAGICASVILTTGIVFAKDINNYVGSLFKLGNHGIGEQQIQTAISENYIQYNASDYIKEKDVSYKLEHSLLNDINLIFSIDFITNFNIDEFNDISISGLQIRDENNNQIYMESEDEKIWKNNIAQSIMPNKIQKSNHEIKASYTLVAPNFPKINTLYISFDKITLYTVSKGVLSTKDIKGNYNLKLDLDSKFNERNTKKYSIAKQTEKNNINVEEVKLTNTGLGITYSTSVENSFGYEFKIFDINHNEIYSNKNNVSQNVKDNKFFIWLDVDSKIRDSEKLLLEITDLNYEKSTFILN